MRLEGSWIVVVELAAEDEASLAASRGGDGSIVVGLSAVAVGAISCARAGKLPGLETGPGKKEE